MKQVRLIQIGLGTVGSAVVQQIGNYRDFWIAQHGIDIGIAAVVTTEGALVSNSGAIDSGLLSDIVFLRRSGNGLSEIASRSGLTPIPAGSFDPGQLNLDRPIVMDAATGTNTSSIAQQVMESGGRVVYSNKAPLAQDTSLPVAKLLWSGAMAGSVRYETTCGAGLPVISTIKSLLATGDEVIEITGCLSGTLGAIFSDIADGKPFSSAIVAAKAAGYTEPDPRDDLSGLDVARKALILARTIGRSVDLADIAVESLVPAELAEGSVELFLQRIGEHDGPIAHRQSEASRNGTALKYVATVPADGPIRVGIETVPTSTVLGALQGPENIISIRTSRYDRYPLTISGPGAGADVTAAGMIADMLELAKAG